MKSITFRRKYGLRRFGFSSPRAGRLWRFLMASFLANAALAAPFATSIAHAGVSVNAGETVVIDAGQTETTNSDAGTLIVSGGAAVDTQVLSGGLATALADGTTTNTEVLAGGREEIGSGGLSENALVSGIQGVDQGGRATGATVGLGGQQVIGDGGVATDSTLGSGGAQYILANGSAIGATIQSAGFQSVSGTNALALSATILDGGQQSIVDQAHASGSIISSGGVQVISGTGAISTDATLLGGAQYVENGALDDSASLQDGAQQIVGAGGVATRTRLGPNTVQFVYSGGAASGAIFSSGAQQALFAGGVDSGATFLSGSFQNVSGVAIGDTVNGGAVQQINGGTAIGAIVDGGQQTVNSGAASNSRIINGGQQLVLSGALALSSTVSGAHSLQLIGIGGSAASSTILDGGMLSVNGVASGVSLSGDKTTESVAFGGVDFGATVGSGATQVVAAGGSALDAQILSSGEQNVRSGGLAISAHVQHGGRQYVMGGSALATSLETGAQEIVSSGGVAQSSQLARGSLAVVYSGGAFRQGSLVSGSVLDVLDGASATQITQNAGATLSATTSSILSGEYISDAVSRSFSVNHGVASGLELEAGGAFLVESGGLAFSTTVGRGGSLSVLSGGSATQSEITAAAILTIDTGGFASASTVADGGELIVRAGGSATGVALHSGAVFKLGNSSGGGASAVDVAQSAGATIRLTTADTLSGQYVSAESSTPFAIKANVASGVVLDGGSWLGVLASGVANQTQIHAGGLEEVFAQGAASNSQIALDGEQLVHSGGLAVGANIFSGGLQQVESGGVASGASIHAGGEQQLSEGAIAIATQALSGATQNVGNGAQAISSIALSGGAVNVSSGGVSIQSIANQGGLIAVSSGGIAVETVVNSGGVQAVYAGGLAQATQVAQGGLQNVLSAGVANNTQISGLQAIQADGSAHSAIILSGGQQVVFAGGLAQATQVAQGATQIVQAGGESDGSVVAGQMQVDGVASGVQLAAGSQIFGLGSINGDLAVGQGSTLSAPSIGAGLSINGNLSFGQGSTYAVAVAPTAGQNGMVQVNGNLSIASGSTLVVQAQAGSYSPGAKYDLIRYTGSESGQFDTIQQNFAYLSPTLSYGAGIVELTLNATSAFTQGGFGILAQNSNQRAVAGALDNIANAGGNGLTSSLSTASENQARQALTQISGSELPAFGQASEADAKAAERMIAERLAQPSAGLDGVSVGRGQLWANGGAAQRHVAGDNGLGSPSVDDTASNATIGAQIRATEALSIGAAATWNNDNLSFGTGAHGHVDGGQVSIFGAYSPVGSPVYGSLIANLGRWDDRLDRNLSVGSVAGRASGFFHTTQASIYGETGLSIQSAYGLIQPHAGLRVGHDWQSRMSDSTQVGSPLFALNSGSAGNTDVSSRLGVRFSMPTTTFFGKPAKLNADVSWDHRFTALALEQSVAFSAAPGAGSWTVNGTGMDRNAAEISLGASIEITKATSVFATVSTEKGSHTNNYGGNVGVQLKW